MTDYAGIIARVSTPGQLDNSSPDEQVRRCRAYCAERGYTVVAEKIEAMSGTLVMARAGFRELCELAERGQLSVIVADIPDRLGRGDAIAKLEFMAQMYGARIEYATPGRDTSTIEGLIQHSAEQMVSGIERLNIKRRTTGGRRALAQAGRVIASGLRIFGYDYVSRYDERGHKVECQLTIREDEAAIVRQMFEWCAIDGLSSHEIARRLSAQRVPTVTDTDKTHAGRKRKGFGEWASGTVRGILANETYAGLWHYAKHDVKQNDTPDGVTHTYRVRPVVEWIPVDVPAIVSEQLFAQAQEQLKRNSSRRPKPVQNEYLLRGRLRCGKCGSRMVGQCTHRTRKDGSSYHYQYYRCHKNWPDYGSDQCDAPNVRGAFIDLVVWYWVRSVLLDDRVFFAGIAADRAEAERARTIIGDAIGALNAQDNKARLKLDRFLDLYGSGEMDKPTYLAKCAEIKQEMARRQTERAELQAQLETCRALTEAQEAELRQYREDVRQGLEHATFEDKVKYLAWLRVECTYNPDTTELVITCLLGETVINGDELRKFGAISAAAGSMDAVGNSLNSCRKAHPSPKPPRQCPPPAGNLLPASNLFPPRRHRLLGPLTVTIRLSTVINLDKLAAGRTTIEIVG